MHGTIGRARPRLSSDEHCPYGANISTDSSRVKQNVPRLAENGGKNQRPWSGQNAHFCRTFWIPLRIAGLALPSVTQQPEAAEEFFRRPRASGQLGTGFHRNGKRPERHSRGFSPCPSVLTRGANNGRARGPPSRCLGEWLGCGQDFFQDENGSLSAQVGEKSHFDAFPGVRSAKRDFAQNV